LKDSLINERERKLVQRTKTNEAKRTKLQAIRFDELAGLKLFNNDRNKLMNYLAASYEVPTACNFYFQHNRNLFLAAIRIYENLYNQEHLFTGMMGMKGM